MTTSGRNSVIALSMLVALIGALLFVLNSMRSETAPVAQASRQESDPVALEATPIVAPTIVESPQTIDAVAPEADTAFAEATTEPEKEPYYWKAFASMRAPAVSDPNSEQNQATLRRLREMRRANLQAESLNENND